MSFHIRVSARGIVINNDKILLNGFGDGEYYNIPGGGVEPGETVKQPSVPDTDSDNPDISSEAVWIPISNLENINYVPYIHEELIEYIKTNRFSPMFMEEPLNKK